MPGWLTWLDEAAPELSWEDAAVVGKFELCVWVGSSDWVTGSEDERFRVPSDDDISLDKTAPLELEPDPSGCEELADSETGGCDKQHLEVERPAVCTALPARVDDEVRA